MTLLLPVTAREQPKWADLQGKVTEEPGVTARQAGVVTLGARRTVPQ